MAEDQIRKVEVDTTKVTKGKVQFFGKVSNPTPSKLARVTAALRYVCLGMVGLVSTSTLFNAHQATVISFWLAVGGLVLGGIDAAVGVAPSKE